MNISYDYYRVFYYAAKYNSFTQAANILGSNQPNVTRAIRNLETALTCKLFARSNRGARLTPEGEKLYRYISQAFEYIQAGEAELAANQSLESGAVTIAASEIALHCCLLPVLKIYREKYPGVRIRLFNNSSPQAIEALKNGLADFAVVTLPRNLPKTFHQHQIAEIQEVPVAGMAFSFLRGKSLTLAELAEYPLVGLGAQTATFDFYSRLFSEHDLKFLPDIEAATVDQILPMIKTNLGIGFVPESFARDEVLLGNVFVLSTQAKIPKRPVCLLKKENQPLSIASQKLEYMIYSTSLSAGSYNIF